MASSRAPVILPAASSLTLTGATGESYRILIADPLGPPPPQGFPVIYLLDAAGSFATMVEAIRMRAHRPDATGIAPAIVVGIAHEEAIAEAHDEHDRHDAADAAGSANGRRGATRDAASDDARDETRTVRDEMQRETRRGRVARRQRDYAPGEGAETFLAFIEQTVKPAIEARFPVDRRRQTLFGHSLAGYFTLWALLAARADFQAFVAVSPSIWWDPERLAAEASRRSGEPPAPTPVRVMITVGEFEQTRAPWQPDTAMTEDALRRRSERRMVNRARAMAETLARLNGIEVDFRCFEQEDHASVIVLSIARALRFVLPPAARLPWPSLRGPVGSRAVVP